MAGHRKSIRLALTATTALIAAGAAQAAVHIEGRVEIAHAPVAGSRVTLWSASSGAPARIGEATSGANGGFAIDGADTPAAPDYYLVAEGGTPAVSAARPDPRLALLSVLGAAPPAKVVVNELTTVASAYTNARFIRGEAIVGNALGLRIGAMNAPNLVDPATGGWGKVVLDPINSTQNTTLANLDTLADLITAFATQADDGWRAKFLAAAAPAGGAAPANTLDAMADIARQPWAAPKALYGLFDAAYPQPRDGSRRGAPFVPYLAYQPDDFALALTFAGGGVYSAGRLMFDETGNLWAGSNWMPGSQSGVINSIGGGLAELSPSGVALSPPITGFTGMGVDGIGWGTAVTRDKAWVTSFNGKIGVFNFDGSPAASEADFPFKQKLLGLMGIGVAADGDVWIADGSDDQLLYFPGGRVKAGKIVKVPGLLSPFDVVVDPQNRVWVSNSQSDTVLRFPKDDPTKTETFRAGISVRALALDSKGNVWVASGASPNFPVPKVPDGASIMEQFRIMGGAVLRYPGPTGVINMIRPDGTQPAPMGFDGGGQVNLPWGVNIDGDDNVWSGQLKGRAVLFMAGAAGGPGGAKTGDVVHVFRGGGIQMITDVQIDAAGNVWAANNWNDPKAVADPNPPGPISTWGGGSGISVIYGVAAPVKPPRMGIVQGY